MGIAKISCVNKIKVTKYNPPKYWESNMTAPNDASFLHVIFMLVRKQHPPRPLPNSVICDYLWGILSTTAVPLFVRSVWRLLCKDERFLNTRAVQWQVRLFVCFWDQCRVCVCVSAARTAMCLPNGYWSNCQLMYFVAKLHNVIPSFIHNQYLLDLDRRFGVNSAKKMAACMMMRFSSHFIFILFLIYLKNTNKAFVM